MGSSHVLGTGSRFVCTRRQTSRHGSPVRRRLGEGRLIAAVSAALLDEFDRGMYQAKCPPLAAAG